MRVLLDYAPRTSAYVRSVVGEDADWSLEALMLANILDSLERGNWQRGGDDKQPRPKPFPRPGVEKPKGFGSVMSLEEIDARAAREEA